MDTQQERRMAFWEQAFLAHSNCYDNNYDGLDFSPAVKRADAMLAERDRRWGVSGNRENREITLLKEDGSYYLGIGTKSINITDNSAKALCHDCDTMKDGEVREI